jgi:hypothetical protein
MSAPRFPVSCGVCQRAQPNDLCVLSTMTRSYHPAAPGGPSPGGSAAR